MSTYQDDVIGRAKDKEIINGAAVTKGGKNTSSFVKDLRGKEVSLNGEFNRLKDRFKKQEDEE